MKKWGLFILFLFCLGGVLAEGNVSDLDENVSLVVKENISDFDILKSEISAKKIDIKKSSCLNYSENSDFYEDYDGHCNLYFGEHLFLPGINIGIEYAIGDSVKLNINSELVRKVSSDYEYSVKLPNRGKMVLYFYDVFVSEKNDSNSGVEFRYNISSDFEESFCLGDECKIYLNDELNIFDYELSLDSIVKVNGSGGAYDLNFNLNHELIELDEVFEGDNLSIGDFRVYLNDVSLSKNYVLFNHYEDWYNFSCIDSDGLDYYSRGFIEGIYSNEDYYYGENDLEYYSFFDYCYSGYYDNPFLVEFYCSDEGFVESGIVSCDKCIDGACVDFNEEELKEIEVAAAFGKANFSEVEVCLGGCLINESCYSDGFILDGLRCEGGMFVENELVETDDERSFFLVRFFRWLF